MKFKQTLWSLCGIAMLWALTTNLCAQVTIGSSTKPVDGALLDLKQYDDATAKVGGRTAIKGLGMPRVHLTKIDDITADIAGVTAANKDEHMGLVVYNINQCLTGKGYENGLYVWDGTIWQPLGRDDSLAPTVKQYTDQDGNLFLAGTFGNAGTWMLESLRAKKYDPIRDNAEVVHQQLSATGSYEQVYLNPIWAYPNEIGSQDANNNTLFLTRPSLGLLYNWAAATNMKGGTIDGLGNAIDEGSNPNLKIMHNAKGYAPMDGIYLVTRTGLY